MDSAQGVIISLKDQLQRAESKNTEIMTELREIKESPKTVQTNLNEQNLKQVTEVDGPMETPSDVESQMQELQSQLFQRENDLKNMEKEVENAQLLRHELSHVQEENGLLQEARDKSLFQERRMCRSLEEVKGELETLSTATLELMEHLETSHGVQQEQSIEIEFLKKAGSNMEGDGKEEVIKLRNALAGELFGSLSVIFPK